MVKLSKFAGLKSGKRHWLSLLILPILACLSVDGSLADDTVLKPAVPKMDIIDDGRAPSTLKGTVEHHFNAAPKPKPKPKRLQSNAVKASDPPLSGNLKGQPDEGRLFKQKAEEDAPPQKFEYTLDRSIGIIGVKFLKVAEKPPVINRVFPGTPAWKVGLRVNDIIVAVDGVPTYGLTKDDCYNLIVGTPNTPVTISVMRQGAFEVKSMLRMDFNEIPDPAVRRDYLHSI